MKWHRIGLLIVSLILAAAAQAYGTRLLFAYVIAPRIAEPIVQAQLSAPVGAEIRALLIASYALSIGLIALAWTWLFGYFYAKSAAKRKLPPMKRTPLVLSGWCFSLIMTAYAVVSTCAEYAESGHRVLSEVYGVSPAAGERLLDPHFFETCRQVRNDTAFYCYIFLAVFLLCVFIFGYVRQRRAKKNG